MSEEKITYTTFTVFATERLTVKEGADTPKILIKAEQVNWDGPERDLETETWLRTEMKGHNTKTAVVVCRPFCPE